MTPERSGLWSGPAFRPRRKHVETEWFGGSTSALKQGNQTRLVAVPEHIDMVVRQVMELHVPGIGLREVVRDIHQEAVCLDLLEAKRGVVRCLGLDVLHPGTVGVDVQASAVPCNESDGFRIGDNGHGEEATRWRQVACLRQCSGMTPD